MTTLYKIKIKLSGSNFTGTMQKKKTNKYRIMKATGISYQTLSNWESERFRPSDKYAEIVGRFLGLIPDDNRIIELEKKQAKIKIELERLR